MYLLPLINYCEVISCATSDSSYPLFQLCEFTSGNLIFLLILIIIAYFILRVFLFALVICKTIMRHYLKIEASDIKFN